MNRDFYGTSLNDVIVVGDPYNYDNWFLAGLDGDDFVIGGRIADKLWGGIGNDTLIGNLGADYLSGERGNDSLWGGEGSDTMYGGDDNDWLAGETDDDVMFGEDGSDSMYVCIFNERGRKEANV